MVRFLEQLGLSVAFLPQPGTDASLARITAFAQQEGLDPAAIEGLIIEAFEEGTASSVDARIACLYTNDGVIVAVRDATIDAALHEVRNAVTGVAGWARIARREGGATARADDALAAIEAASMVAIEAATLAPRADAEPTTRERRSPDRRASVAVLIAQARELTEPLAQERGVRLEVSAPAELRVAVTRTELLSALSNLFKNAIEGSERGDRVAVGATRVGEHIAITVENPARGAALPVIGKTTKGVGRGIGLGLVARIARHAEGSLGFAHAAGDTMVATLTLPDAEQRRLATRGAAGAGSKQATAPAERRGRDRTRAADASGTRPRARTSTRVLVLDDETSIRGLVTTALSFSGISAVGAGGPNEVPREGTFDLALVDLRLGEYDGLVVARDLVACGRVRRIALMTGAPIGQRPHDVLAIVRKPFDLDELTARIAEWTAPEPLRRVR